MHNLPFDTINIDSADLQALTDIYKALTATYDVSVSNGIDLPINSFDLFNNHPDKTIGGILQLNHPTNPCYLVFIKIHGIYYSRDGHADHYYTYKAYGCIIARKDYGRVLIRRETFADKILSLIHPVELNFPDDKPFNHKFFVCTNDEQKALLAMGWNFRNAVMDIKSENLIIEAVNNVLVLGNNNDLFVDEVVDLAAVLVNLASNF